MNGQIILPKFYETRYTDNYKFLLRAIVDKYGFSYEYADNPIIKEDTELVITFAIPQHNRITNYPWRRFINLPKHIKLIAWLRDIQCYNDPDCYVAISAMMERANMIITNSDSFFSIQYPDYIGKMFFMGDFFAPHDRYELGINPAPRYKCLLSGATNKKVYPLRHQILLKGDYGLMEVIPPPYGGMHDYVGDKYAKLLHRFFCCATCTSVYDYALSKHMEIPAAGSLLLTNSCSDLIRLGFEPMKHYVPVNEYNAINMIQNVLDDPGRYQNIREDGYKFVHENHGLNNRIIELSSLIERMV